MISAVLSLCFYGVLFPSSSLSPQDVEARLRGHVYSLAADSMEGRGIRTDGIDSAERYILDQIMAMDLCALFPWGQTDSFPGPEARPLVNILASLPEDDHTGELVLLTAHYDHLGLTEPDSCGRQVSYNGAHDNASGVAMVLEAARILMHQEVPRRTVGFVFFSGEEEGLWGSRHFGSTLRIRGREVFAVVNVDAVGHLGSGALLTVGLQGQAGLDSLVAGALDKRGICLERTPRSYASGDHAPFLELGIPAFMITTGPHPLMNSPGDDPETLDYSGMRILTEAVVCLVMDLADLTTCLEEPPPPEQMPPLSRGKKARFGIVPDFTFQGEGVRAQAMVPGSPAELAGVQPGDVIRSIGDYPVANLKDLARALREHDPGTEVVVLLRRDGEQRALTVTLVAR